MTESEAKDIARVLSVKTNLKNQTIEIDGDFGEKSEEEIINLLNTTLSKHGYTLSTLQSLRDSFPSQGSNRKWSDFQIAVPIALGFAVLFVILQKTGLINLIGGENMTYGTVFVVGIIASLSTCMAVVGGLVLSMSATFAKENDKIKPQVLFHLGRLVSFFVLGGVIGAIGSAFTLNITATFILNIIIGIVMLILGINLLEVFHWSKKLQPSMPKFISKHALGIHKLNHTLTPLLVGIATFFLPCGFTQSMQLYTLSTGNFFQGGLTMLAFALGTFPVLLLISFSALSIKNNSKSGIFFKSAGLIVILFALFNLINSLVVIGLIPPIFNL